MVSIEAVHFKTKDMTGIIHISHVDAVFYDGKRKFFMEFHPYLGPFFTGKQGKELRNIPKTIWDQFDKWFKENKQEE